MTAQIRKRAETSHGRATCNVHGAQLIGSGPPFAAVNAESVPTYPPTITIFLHQPQREVIEKQASRISSGRHATTQTSRSPAALPSFLNFLLSRTPAWACWLRLNTRDPRYLRAPVSTCRGDRSGVQRGSRCDSEYLSPCWAWRDKTPSLANTCVGLSQRR